MINDFIKYQSLGNHFILVDRLLESETSTQALITDPAWPQCVRDICMPNFGIGADGILLVAQNQASNLPEMRIFNADGSQAENCLNGLRCVAHYLFTHKELPRNFTIKLGNRTISCSIVGDKNNPEIITAVGTASYQEYTTIQAASMSFTGHVTHIGNPHFVIEQKISTDFLREYGKALESHAFFPHKTNVEFFWMEPTTKGSTTPFTITMIPFERGCGLTLACSTGAAVTLDVLQRIGRVHFGEKVTCIMPGGAVIGWLDEQKTIFLQAQAHYVFSGCLP